MLALGALVPVAADAKLKTRTFSGPLVAGDEGQATGTLSVEVKVKAKTGIPKQLISARLEGFQSECSAPSPPIQVDSLEVLPPVSSNEVFPFGISFGDPDAPGLFIGAFGKFIKKATVVKGSLLYEYFESQESPNYCKVRLDFELTS